MGETVNHGKAMKLAKNIVNLANAYLSLKEEIESDREKAWKAEQRLAVAEAALLTIRLSDDYKPGRYNQLDEYEDAQPSKETDND